MAGNQVLEWTDLDSEIKTAGLKDVRGFLTLLAHIAQRSEQDPLAPPDL